MSIQESPTPLHWNYFLAIEDDIARLSRYLEPAQANFDSYSLELARILFASASEVDVVAKQTCPQSETQGAASNMDQYRERLLEAHPEIVQSKVFIPKFGLTLTPWEAWSRGINPAWWRAYNKVKHERHVHFPEANLKNALNAAAGLFSINLFHYRQQAHDGMLVPDPILFRAGPPFTIDNRAWPPHTYVYRLSASPDPTAGPDASGESG